MCHSAFGQKAINVIRKVSDTVQKPIVKELATQHYGRTGIMNTMRSETICPSMFEATVRKQLAVDLLPIVENKYSTDVKGYTCQDY